MIYIFHHITDVTGNPTLHVEYNTLYYTDDIEYDIQHMVIITVKELQMILSSSMTLLNNKMVGREGVWSLCVNRIVIVTTSICVCCC